MSIWLLKLWIFLFVLFGNFRVAGIPVGLFLPVYPRWGNFWSWKWCSCLHIVLELFLWWFSILLIFSLSGTHIVLMLDNSDWSFNLIISLLLLISFSFYLFSGDFLTFSLFFKFFICIFSKSKSSLL